MTNICEPIKVVFFATPGIAFPSLKELVSDSNFVVQALVVQASKPAGRGKKIQENPLKTFALQNNIKVFEPFKLSVQPEIIEELETLAPDFFVTFAFGQILNQRVLDIPKFGTVNLHASLLPKYRGANPIRQALLDGVHKTGVTTMLTVLELDAGDICLQEEISLDENTTSVDLTAKIAEISPALIKKTLFGIKSCNLEPTVQDHKEATFTKKTKKEDKIINCFETAKSIHNKVRALCDNFCCQITFGGKIVKVLKTRPVACNKEVCKVGVVLEVSKKGVLVGTGNDALLIEIVKPEGKNEMSAHSWSLGARLKIGDKLE